MPNQERSFSDVVQSIVDNIRSMIRSEIRLATAEFKEETAKAANATKILGAGVVLALYAGGLFLFTLVKALETAMAPWAAALVITILVAAIAAVAINAGRTRLKRLNAVPERTVQTVKENLLWAKHQIRS
jgi:uncharacterized membrane protein YqjE